MGHASPLHPSLWSATQVHSQWAATPCIQMSAVDLCSTVYRESDTQSCIYYVGVPCMSHSEYMVCYTPRTITLRVSPACAQTLYTIAVYRELACSPVNAPLCTVTHIHTTLHPNADIFVYTIKKVQVSSLMHKCIQFQGFHHWETTLQNGASTPLKSHPVVAALLSVGEREGGGKSKHYDFLSHTEVF